MAEPLQKLPEIVMQSLEQKILDGFWPPGTRLPPERQLARELDVSRHSLREAIHSLVNKGLLETRQGSGTRVVEHPETHYQGQLEDLLPTCPSLQKSTLDFRILLETEAVRLATLNASRQQRLELVDIARLLDEQLDQVDIEKDLDFHLKISEYCGNPLIFHSMRQLRSLITENITDNAFALFSRPELLRQHRKRHLPIARAIELGNPERAVKSVREHFRVFQEVLENS